jgi:hypothetical protein
MACLYTQGTVVEVENNELTPAFEIVGSVTSFSNTDGDAADIEVTTLASTKKEFCQGLADEGSFTLEINRDFADVGQAELEEARSSQSTRNFRITLSDSTVLTFAGNVKSFTLDGQVDDVVRSTATIKISGDIAYA